MSLPLSSLYKRKAGPVWRCFDELCTVPRPSKNEEMVRQWLLDISEQHGWECRDDTIGNIVIVVPGEGSLEYEPPLVLQGHMDMVCEKNAGIEHDFMTDPIVPRISNGWVYATDTTLGADNGMGVALALALAAEPMPNRLPLEILITVDEETGLTGAMELDPDIVTGKHLLNLDSEEDWQLIIGCAGGVDMTVSFPVTVTDVDMETVEVEISGLQGGHSGVQINEPRANAIRAAVALAVSLQETHPDVQLCSLTGGNKKNAIPREASMVLCGVTVAEVEAAAEAIVTALKTTDQDAEIQVSAGPSSAITLPFEAVTFVHTGPQGVLAMDTQFPDLVKTSNNMSVATMEGEHLHILMHGRSSDEQDKTALIEDCRALSQTLGATFDQGGNYPGWAPSRESALLVKGQAVYADLFGKQPDVVCIHAGLEAGIIGGKLQTGELLSYGPTILNPHSPDEKVEIASVDRVFRFLKAFVSTPIEK